MEKLVFQASHQLSAEWPIVLIDFDTMNLVDEEEIELGLKVLNHLSEPALTQPIYYTCQGEPIIIAHDDYSISALTTLHA